MQSYPSTQSYFYFVKGLPLSYCKECWKAIQREKRRLKYGGKTFYEAQRERAQKEGRRCSICKTFFPLTRDFFYRDKNWSGFAYKCIKCTKEKKQTEESRKAYRLSMQRWRMANPEKNLLNERRYRELNREKVRETGRKYNNSSHGKLRRAESQRARREQINRRLRDAGYYTRPDQVERKKRWNEANREKRKLYVRKSNKKPMRRIKLRYLNTIYHALRSQGLRKTQRTIDLVGCTTAEFKRYFESLFVEGMSWDLFYSGKIHVDHIQPTCSFDLSIPEERRKAFHFTNTRPLWAKDNLKKAPLDRKKSIKLKNL
jgi:hypothetical protein